MSIKGGGVDMATVAECRKCRKEEIIMPTYGLCYNCYEVWMNKHRRFIKQINKKNKSCYFCNVKKDIQIHHITYEGDFSKITFLCKKCHLKFHGLMKAYKEHLRKSPYWDKPRKEVKENENPDKD